MITPVQSSTSSKSGGGLFRLPDGRNLFLTFALVTTLFLLWGFCNGMIDILNKHFRTRSTSTRSSRASCSLPIIWLTS